MNNRLKSTFSRKPSLIFFMKLATFSLVFAVVISGQVSTVRADDSKIVTVSGKGKDYVGVSGNSWGFEFCSKGAVKGVIQQKVKGKWKTLKKVVKSNQFITSRSNCDAATPVVNSWAFAETKNGTKQYRFKQSGSKWNKAFTVTVEDNLSPAVVPDVSPTLNAPSARIAELLVGLKFATELAYYNSVASNDRTCMQTMADWLRWDAEAVQYRYQTGSYTHQQAIDALVENWKMANVCKD